jgi:hypothetical protein
MSRSEIFLIVVMSLLGLLGVLILCGALFKWKWLIDPDEKYANIYSQAKLKKIFGIKILLIYTYIMGCGFILISVFGIIDILTHH